MHEDQRSITWGWRGAWYCQRRQSMKLLHVWWGSFNPKVKVFFEADALKMVRSLIWIWCVYMLSTICYARLLSMALRSPLRRVIAIQNWPAAIVKDFWIALASMGYIILVFKLYRWNWTDERSCCCCFESVYFMARLCHAQYLELEATLILSGKISKK